jgi:conjugal transfer pilus assembly protein TraF
MGLFSAAALAASEFSGDFYSEKARGWFWYERQPDPPVEKKEPPVAPPSATKSVETQPVVPPFGSVAWIREAMPKLLDKAVDEPTPENVSAYYYVQRVMKDKSERFTKASQQVVLADPLLDENTRRPFSQYGSAAMDRRAETATEEAIREVAKKAGIWFFFKGGCEFCLLQSPLLKGLQAKYGFTVIPISMDGTSLENGDYPEHLVDRGQSTKISEKFGMDMNYTPSLFLVKPPNEIIPITFGLTSASEITSRALLQAATAGWIDRELYDKTRKQREDLDLSGLTVAGEVKTDDTKEILKAFQQYGKKETQP